MFKILSDLLSELFSSRPKGVEPNSNPLAMWKYQPQLDLAYSRMLPPATSTTDTKKKPVAPKKYQGSETSAPVDSGLDFSL
jgi:hypothetical protein